MYECIEGYQPANINSMLAVIDPFFRFVGWEDCRVKYLRIQRRIFREEAKELDRDEYDRLSKRPIPWGVSAWPS